MLSSLVLHKFASLSPQFFFGFTLRDGLCWCWIDDYCFYYSCYCWIRQRACPQGFVGTFATVVAEKTPNSLSKPTRRADFDAVFKFDRFYGSRSVELFKWSITLAIVESATVINTGSPRQLLQAYCVLLVGRTGNNENANAVWPLLKVALMGAEIAAPSLTRLMGVPWCWNGANCSTSPMATCAHGEKEMKLGEKRSR